MPSLLHIDTSPLETSVSRELTREFVKAWKAKHPNGTVTYRDLTKQVLPPIDAHWIGANFTPAAQLSAEQKNTLALSDELVAELKAADEYVLGVAMHNFSIPSVLKLWIDLVVRLGVTVSYGEKGPEGLLSGKKVAVLSASGGVYDAEPRKAFNFLEPYLKTILGFIGLTDVKFVSAGGTQELSTGSVERNTFLQPKLDLVRAIVA